MKPNMSGLNQLEAATLLEEMNVINGMLSHGTPEEKKRAKELFEKNYEPLILSHVNQIALSEAQKELGFTDDDLGFPETNDIE